MGFTDSSHVTNNCGLSASAQVSATRLATAQIPLDKAQAAFSSALTDIKNAVPGAKRNADAAAKQLKKAKAEMKAAEQAEAAAAAKSTQGKSDDLEGEADASNSTGEADSTPVFNPRKAFQDVSGINSLDDFPAIPAENCGKTFCVRDAPYRKLAACEHNIHDAFCVLGAKALKIVHGHLHGSRFADKPKEVQKAAKECFAVVNLMMNNARGGDSGRKGGKAVVQKHAGRGRK